jgi:hypothetical protein
MSDSNPAHPNIEATPEIIALLEAEIVSYNTRRVKLLEAVVSGVTSKD